MAYERHFDLPEPVTEPACTCLRSKRMYVEGDLRTPEQADDETSQYYWCNLTQHVIGPDSQMVERRRCITGRSCYRETF